MKFSPLRLPDVILIEPELYRDERGWFLENYHLQKFTEHGLPVTFVQDNHSCSARGVLRGLHYQKVPHAQGKLVRVVRGEIFDVAVDIRKGSTTFGQWVGEFLDAEKKKTLYLPPGFAHGFCALQDGTEVLYKVTDFYSAADARGILWNDPEIGIQWPDLGQPFILSPKDRKNPRLKDLR